MVNLVPLEDFGRKDVTAHVTTRTFGVLTASVPPPVFFSYRRLEGKS
jgi:hypothetical protein